MTVYALRISDLDRGFLAGYVEGEACFTITELNGGQSFSCGAVLCARDDDQDLLEWLAALTGLGRLRRVAARRTSHPQISWTIESQDECIEFARLLAGGGGFHGRRAAELAIWTEAVRVWTLTGGASRHAALRSLKTRLHAAKKIHAGAPEATPLSGTRPQTLGYISGLVCAEGCFYFNRLEPRFSMHLRRDDRPLLELLRSHIGIGNIYDHAPGPGSNPSSIWMVAARAQLEGFAARLYDAGLPGRKGAELGVWELAVSERCSAARLGVHPREAILRLAAGRLAEIRRYKPSGRSLLELARRDVRAECVAALESWSGATDGPLTCGGYSLWRRDNAGCPTRNTVAKEFGSWHAALEAAGLASRVARKPRATGGEVRRRQRRVVQRARVVEAVRRFEAEHGRRPRAMEFFKWRAASFPDSPAQGTVYNLFPGGWDAVLRSLDEDHDAV